MKGGVLPTKLTSNRFSPFSVFAKIHLKEANMKGNSLATIVATVFVTILSTSASAQSSSFTYQGRLQDGGTNANGNYDLQFTLWDSLSGGTQQPQPSPLMVSKPSVTVTNGVFTVQLDFGLSAFPGADRFLETSVRSTGGGAFTLLSPRQPITSTPYAIRSASAASADSVPVGSIPPGNSNYIQNSTGQQASANFNISGNGTVGGTFQANSIRALGQYRIGNASDPVLAAPNTNLFVGVNSGTANTGGNNTFLGFGAGRNNTSGGNNTFVGAGSGTNNLAGGGNSFLGLNAGGANLGGSSNSFFGNAAGGFNTDGNQNSFFGAAAGNQVTTGSNNSFFGNTTGISTTTEFFNSLLGGFADTAPGISNATAIGARAKVTQSNSLVLGSIAGINSAGFNTNVGIGTTAPTSRLHVVGDTNLVGNLNVSGTLNANLPTGSGSYIQNTTSQQSSSNFNISGDGTLGGTLTVQGPVVANNNITLNGILSGPGANLGNLATGSISIGTSGGGFNQPLLFLNKSGNTTNLISFGASEWQVGNANTTDFKIFRSSVAQLYLKSTGEVGIGNASPSFTLHVSGETRTNILSIDNFVSNSGGPQLCASTTTNRVGLCSSSLRYKTDVRTFRDGLDIINRLRPISFTWREGGMHDLGLAAEEVEKVEPLLTYRNKQGEIEGVRYDQLSAVFINAFKEQQAQIDQQQEQLKRQAEQIKRQEDQASKQRAAFASQQQELDALKKLVCRSHARATACR